MKKLRAFHSRQQNKDAKQHVNCTIRWLSDPECDNSLVIDNNFAQYIRRVLNSGRPIGVSFNWTKVFKMPRTKTGIGGEDEEHAVVIRGYDDKGVFIVDSHFECYRGKRKKYRGGYYKLSWETFLLNTTGDLIIIR